MQWQRGLHLLHLLHLLLLLVLLLLSCRLLLFSLSEAKDLVVQLVFTVKLDITSLVAYRKL